MAASMNEEAMPDMTDPEMPPRDQVKQLVSDFRTLAMAEFDYYRVRFAYSRTVAKWTGIYVAVALFALFGTIVALILGILLSLAAAIGPLWATVLVTLIFAGLTALFAILARKSSKNFSFPELGEGDQDG